MTVIQVIINGALLGGLYLLMAQGLNLIFGVMRIVNFAHGAVIVISGLIVFSLSTHAGLNPFLCLPIVFAVMFVLGIATQRLLIERVRGSGTQRELLTLLVTYGLSFILINIGQTVWGSDYRGVPYLQAAWGVGSFRFVQALVVGAALAVVLSGALYWWLRSTRSGKSLRATAQTSIGAESCGIDTRRMRVIAFAIGTGLAGAAGMLVILVRPVSPELGTELTIISFVVIALGGLGDYLGAALGAVVLGVATTLAGYGLSATAQSAVPYVLLLLIMLLRPQGLSLQRLAR